MLIICRRCGKRYNCVDDVKQLICDECGTVMEVVCSLRLQFSISPPMVLSQEEVANLLQEIFRYARSRIELYDKYRKVSYIG